MQKPDKECSGCYTAEGGRAAAPLTLGSRLGQTLWTTGFSVTWVHRDTVQSAFQSHPLHTPLDPWGFFGIRLRAAPLTTYVDFAGEISNVKPIGMTGFSILNVY